jgi:hypothetical protein
MTKYDEDDDPIVVSDPREDEESDIDDIPQELRALRTQAYDKSISDLVQMIKEGDIFLNPEYQRSYNWDDTRASLLVESILLNVPIPVIYVAEDKEGRWDVVDGLQRLNSLARFANNEFKLKGLEVLSDLNKQRYHELNPKAQRIFRNGIIRIILIFRESHPDIKYEIFMRLNRGAVTLTEQELRNCLYRGEFNNLLLKLRQKGSVLKLFRRKAVHKRMGDAELILRYFMVRTGFNPETKKVENYTGNMRSSLNHYMQKQEGIDDSRLAELEREFLSVVELTLEVFGDDALQRVDDNGEFDGRLNRALMDSVLTAFALLAPENIVAKKNEIKQAMFKLLKDAAFVDLVTVRTSEKKKMDSRVARVFAEFEKTLNK